MTVSSSSCAAACSRKVAADREASRLFALTAHAFTTLLARGIVTERRRPKAATARTRVRDALGGVSLCVQSIEELNAVETVDDAVRVIENFYLHLGLAWDRPDLSSDVFEVGRSLLSGSMRTAYRAFIDGDDRAFATVRERIEAASARTGNS